MEVLDIGIEIPDILAHTILTNMVFMMVEVLNCMQVMYDVDLGLKIPATLLLAILKFIITVTKVVTMLMVNIGIKIP